MVVPCYSTPGVGLGRHPHPNSDQRINAVSPHLLGARTLYDLLPARNLQEMTLFLRHFCGRPPRRTPGRVILTLQILLTAKDGVITGLRL